MNKIYFKGKLDDCNNSQYHRNPTTSYSASLHTEFSSVRISRTQGSEASGVQKMQVFSSMPKIENSFTKKETLNETEWNSKFSILIFCG